MNTCMTISPALHFHGSQDIIRKNSKGAQEAVSRSFYAGMIIETLKAGFSGGMTCSLACESFWLGVLSWILVRPVLSLSLWVQLQQSISKGIAFVIFELVQSLLTFCVIQDNVCHLQSS